MNDMYLASNNRYLYNTIITFSSEKVLDLCKMGPPPLFFSNVHVLTPSEPEKNGFHECVFLSVCVSVCVSVCLCVDF